jgi:hypothetical protein
MASWPLWMQLLRQPEPPPGIDMGNGRMLDAEDVLEGHFRRVTARRQPTSHQVVVQVGDNMTAAIAVLAPDLAPLTQVAEQVSGAVPLVQPTAHFRENLHEALERTHRQQSAQRILGMRPVPHAKLANPLGWWMLLVGACVAAIVALTWGWRARQGTATVA